MKKKFEVFVVLVTIGFMASAALANYTERQKITSIPRGVGAQHGNAVAISGNTMVVGAQHDSTVASQAGSVFVYVLDGTTWTQQAQFLASDGAVADKFGYSVAINGDTIVVGAYNDDAPLSNGGSAYVFVRNGGTWSFQQKLTAANGTADDQFGSAVGVFGNTIAVGANHADQQETGAVYIFFRGGTVWTPGPILLPTAPSILADHFGESLAFDGTRLVVGAPGDDTPLTAAGAVYVYLAGDVQFFFEQKLTIPDGGNGHNFGGSVAIDGTTLVGGARQYSPGAGQTAWGAAYPYEFNGSSWIPQGRLTASDAASFDRFGYSVAVNGDTVAVGAREDDTAVGPDAGSAYVFLRTGTVWTEDQKLTPADPFNGDRFGISMAFAGAGKLVIGAAEKALTNPNGQGAVYYFTDPQAGTRFDFEGDGKADISIFRPSTGTWYWLNSSNGDFSAVQFGLPNDRPVPADFDGDGRTDIAIYRSGTWYILRSSNQTFYAAQFGLSADKPAPGDYDGDGFADIAVFRPSTATWYILSTAYGVLVSPWGSPGDIPVNADYDGDGLSDVSIFRPADGTWWLFLSTGGSVFATTFGVGTDKPVPADYTGDGKADIAIWRPSNGNWYILRSEDLSFYAAPFGATGDIPVAADYDGDGRADLGVFRPGSGNWFVLRSTQGILILQFGLNGDIPVPSAFVP